MRVRVGCHAGYKAEERPEAFSMGVNEFRITEILEQWLEPGFSFFRVRTDHEREFILRHDENQDQWQATWSDLLK